VFFASSEHLLYIFAHNKYIGNERVVRRNLPQPQFADVSRYRRDRKPAQTYVSAPQALCALQERAVRLVQHVT
jgi:hypothetical protein